MPAEERDDTSPVDLGAPPRTSPPPSVRAAILARVVAQTVGRSEAPLLDGRYRLLEEIGRGGAGTVWKAELRPLGRLVAVKLLRAGAGANPKAVPRLVREAMTVSKLGHEHIVRVNDVGMDEHGSPYVAMELLEGEPLSKRILRGERMTWPEVVDIALQLCDALTAAHAVGVVHRDIKPANIFASRGSDGRWRCKLLDFGLCTGGSGTPIDLTKAGELLGTPGYAAPEQIRGDVVDGRADLYGLACVMVELLTGRAAFAGTSRQERVRNQIAGRRRADLEQVGLPPAVVSLLDDTLDVDPERRPDTPQVFVRALVEASRAPSPAPRQGSALRTGGWVASFIALASASAYVVVTLSRPSPEARALRPLLASVAVPTPTPDPPEVARAEPRVDAPTPVPEATTTVEPPVVRPKRRRRPTRTRPAEPVPPADATATPAPARTYPEGIRDPFAL